MKRKFKPILLITLFVIMVVVAFVPTKSYAGYIEWPGVQYTGPKGDGCLCPLAPWNCGCRFHFNE